MRSLVFTCSLLLGLVVGCSFDPKISGSLLCNPAKQDCPRGYSCQKVELAAYQGVSACCTKPGCTELSPEDRNRIIGVSLERAKDAGANETDAASDAPGNTSGASCGNNKVDPGESCDPLSMCPTMCPNMGCMKRKLAEGGSCQARCVDDGTETECVGGDGCCPETCNATNDSDCRASCGNMAIEAGETCDPGDTCPTACPAIGCTLQKAEGSSRTCNVKCVDAGKQTACVTGDSCCPMGCTTDSDKDCECVCGNGIVESQCGEICDPLGSCPQACPPMGCQLRRLVNAGNCQAQCVNDVLQTQCVSGDGCCPGGCNATNDNDCTARCGNGAMEAGETCDPPSMCPRSCPWNGCGRRKLEGSADSCTARCVDDGMQTACASGDGCCPSACNSTNDNDCSARCGNGVREGNEKCDGNCPTSCPAMGCQRRRLQGSAAQCNAECVDDSVITACTNGDACCANGCTSVNDNDCSARCGNGVREGNEKCDGADCPASCPAMGCQRRRLLGSAAQCTAECVNDSIITMCMNGDACCPANPMCNRNNDNNCPAVCGNGAVEMGEFCDPVATCMTQSQTCVSDRNTIRTPSGNVANCTFRCTTMPRACGGNVDNSDNNCPTACTPCGAVCGAMQDIDCKLNNGSPCTHANQCMGGACTTFFRDIDGDGFGGASTQVCGTTPPSGHITTGGDCCDSDVNARPGQMTYFIPTNACGSYDYNCNRIDETRYNSGECFPADASCFAGYTTTPVPGCGGKGSYRTCLNNTQCGNLLTNFAQQCR
jgi:hypothetical protein